MKAPTDEDPDSIERESTWGGQDSIEEQGVGFSSVSGLTLCFWCRSNGFTTVIYVQCFIPRGALLAHLAGCVSCRR
jgi:hypothetical protein